MTSPVTAVVATPKVFCCARATSPIARARRRRPSAMARGPVLPSGASGRPGIQRAASPSAGWHRRYGMVEMTAEVGPASGSVGHGLPQGGVLPASMIAPSTNPIRHFFTVDVEEYFQVSAFDGVLSRDAWPDMPSRVEQNVECVLDLLAQRGVMGTFFTLGWVAK